MRNFRELKVWEKAHQVTLYVYRLTKVFPSEELYGLTAQMRRSSASVPTNIAEGCGRDGEADFARFLSIAMGSASELEYQVLLAKDLGYLAQTDCERLVDEIEEVKKMLTGLIRKLKRAKYSSQQPAVSGKLIADR